MDITAASADPAPDTPIGLTRPRIALVCMPFASAQRPSIQIGLITAIARRAGFEVDAFHFNLDLALELTPALYEPLCEHRGHMTGEWLFAPAAFGESAPADEAAYFEAFPEDVQWADKLGKDTAFLCGLRQRVLPAFIDKCLAAVDWGRYGLVGFSSVFQQNVSCLALARRIKRVFPAVKIVFGGANMEGEMGREYARAFPFVDYVISGEADHAFPELLRTVSENDRGKRATNGGGLMVLDSDGRVTGTQAAPVHDLDASPVPEYHHYFSRATELGLLPQYKSIWMLPFETSRGCWWGQKYHCTFCGLNGMGMAYRAKTPARVLSELSELARTYRICSFEAVDNILDPRYIEKLFAPIEEARLDYRFFYEVKVNLTRAQIKTLYRGGVRSMQPGIESMSTRVLQLMLKGCTMLQNVRCLKWCLYYGITVSWNLLWGFPGETEADYQAQLDVLRSISHLEPPHGGGRIWVERFSPYYSQPEKFPITNIRPEASYRYVYPKHVDLHKAAYFFDYEMGNTIQCEAFGETLKFMREWQESWHSDHRHTLTYRRTDDSVLIDYNWGSSKQGTYTFSGPLALIYEACSETMHTVPHMVDYLRKPQHEYDCSPEEVRDAMDELCRGRLMLRENDSYLSLALPANPGW
jgi:ribosomal peptide maturation radical SAM protein 1